MQSPDLLQHIHVKSHGGGLLELVECLESFLGVFLGQGAGDLAMLPRQQLEVPVLLDVIGVQCVFLDKDRLQVVQARLAFILG